MTDEKLQFIDAPGLNDPNMPIGTWIEELKEDGMKNRKINLCLIVMMQKVRPDTLDKTNILITMEALNNIQPENIGIVFTRCDENPGFSKTRAHNFVSSLLNSMSNDGYPVPPAPG